MISLGPVKSSRGYSTTVTLNYEVRSDNKSNRSVFRLTDIRSDVEAGIGRGEG